MLVISDKMVEKRCVSKLFTCVFQRILNIYLSKLIKVQWECMELLSQYRHFYTIRFGRHGNMWLMISLYCYYLVIVKRDLKQTTIDGEGNENAVKQNI